MECSINTILFNNMAKHMKKLQGVFCLYKPAGVPLKFVSNMILTNLVGDLNEQHQPLKENLVKIEGSTGGKLEVNVEEKLAVHPLAIGSVYQKEDFKLFFSNYLASTSSGVCLAGLNKAVSVAQMIKYSRIIKVFKISGVLGEAASDFYHTGKIFERSTYSHVKLHHIEKILMTIQASHQRRAMDYLGESLNPQEIYEALSDEGIVRPEGESIPLAYALKCVEFDPPSFTIELGFYDFLPSDEVAVIFLDEADIVSDLSQCRRKLVKLCNSDVSFRKVIIAQETPLTCDAYSELQRFGVIDLGLTMIPVTTIEEASKLLKQMVICETKKDGNPFRMNQQEQNLPDDDLLNTLQTVPGLGGKKALLIIEKFLTLENIANASEGDLAQVLGSAQAQSVYKFFHTPF